MELNTAKTPQSISIALVFIILSAIIWLAFGLIVAADLHPAIPKSDVIRWAMASMSLLTSGILLGFSFLLKRKSRVAYWLTLGLLIIISILTVTDEFGIADLVVLMITLVPLGLLLKDRGWYLQPRPDPI